MFSFVHKYEKKRENCVFIVEKEIEIFALFLSFSSTSLSLSFIPFY